MDFRLLGPLDGTPSTIARSRSAGLSQRSLLAVLLLQANEADLHRQPDRPALGAVAAPRPPPRASRCTCPDCGRRSGEGRLVTHGKGYLLRAERPPSSTSSRFEQLADEARRAAPESAARKLTEALAMGAARRSRTSPTSRSRRSRSPGLRRCAWPALEQRIDADLARGRHAELVGELEALVARCPLRERLRCQLMLALYRSARQAEALDAYRAARRELSGGARPGPERGAEAARAGDLASGPGARSAAGSGARGRSASGGGAGARPVGPHRSAGARRPRSAAFPLPGRWRHRVRGAS